MSQAGIIRISSPTEPPYAAWQSFAQSHPQGSWFQSAAFFEFIGKWPEAEAVLLVAVNGQPESKSAIAGSLLAVMVHETVPKGWRGFSLGAVYKKMSARTIIYGGPLLARDTRVQQKSVLKDLVQALQHTAGKRTIFTQFRNFFDCSSFIPLLASLGFAYHERLNLLPDTSSREAAWNSLWPNRRRQIRLSKQNGAEIVIDPDPEQIDDWYEILYRLYREKIRKPLPSKAFFHALAQPSHPRTSLFVLISFQNKIIGGAACVIHPKKTLYEWYACGLDQEYKQHQVYPSVLATWAAMEYAALNDIPQFDFMGMGIPGKAYGVRTFKKAFGGHWVNYGRLSKVNKPFLYGMAEIAYNITTLRLLPKRQ